MSRRHTIHKIFSNEVDQLRRIVIGMGLSPDEGEDLLQDVFQEALEHSPQDRGQVSLRYWLRRVTVNRALRHFRRKQVHQRGLDALQQKQRPAIPEPPVLAATDEETKILRACLAQMRESLRAPLVLRHCCDYNATEIGKILDVKSGTVRKRLCDARVQLAQMLTNRGVTS